MNREKQLITGETCCEANIITFDTCESDLRHEESFQVAENKRLAMIHVAVTPARKKRVNHESKPC